MLLMFRLVSFSSTVHSVHPIFPNSPLFFQYFNSGTERNEGSHNKSTTNTLKADFNLKFHVTTSKLKDHSLTSDSHIFQSHFLFPLCICLPDVFYAPSGCFHLVSTTPSTLLFWYLHLSSPVLLLLSRQAPLFQRQVVLRDKMLCASASFSLLNADSSLEHKGSWMPVSSSERAFSTCLSICRIWIFDSQTLESDNASFSLHDQQHLRQLHSENNTQYAYAYIKAAWHWHFKCRIKLIWPLFSKST